MVCVALPVLSVLLLGVCALRVWRGLKAARGCLKDLNTHLSGLTGETSALSARLDAAAASSRLAGRGEAGA